MEKKCFSFLRTHILTISPFPSSFSFKYPPSPTYPSCQLWEESISLILTLSFNSSGRNSGRMINRRRKEPGELKSKRIHISFSEKREKQKYSSLISIPPSSSESLSLESFLLKVCLGLKTNSPFSQNQPNIECVQKRGIFKKIKLKKKRDNYQREGGGRKEKGNKEI